MHLSLGDLMHIPGHRNKQDKDCGMQQVSYPLSCAYPLLRLCFGRLEHDAELSNLHTWKCVRVRCMCVLHA